MGYVYLSKSGNVKIDDRVVGTIIPVPGQGYVYKHFKFGLKTSSALLTIEELMLRVEKYLQKSLA